VYKSPTYGKIMKSMMTRSDNLFAEAMLRTIDGGESRTKAISTELKYWKSQGLNVDVLTLRDGSGLARGNKFSPKFLGELLAKMAEGKNCATYVKLFPIVGQEGTVRNFLKDTALQGKMVMKSGSMSGVHCYAGYKIDKDGTPTHAVVVMVNNFYCQRSQVKKSIEKLLLNNLQ
jgi:D-alanyl-D-alanine carboxypeptidase/D-alanyl-D-alanine-endopeptidase (penicillin-binding protein 4)